MFSIITVCVCYEYQFVTLYLTVFGTRKIIILSIKCNAEIHMLTHYKYCNLKFDGKIEAVEAYRVVKC
jgi:hypothetical protein